PPFMARTGGRVGDGLDQLALPLRERPGFLFPEPKDTDDISFAPDRHREDGSELADERGLWPPGLGIGQGVRHVNRGPFERSAAVISSAPKRMRVGLLVGEMLGEQMRARNDPK